MTFLDKAVRIAIEAHAGQVDRYGQPYIQHPLRVMAAGVTEEEKIVGILHDVVEDSDWTIEMLREEGFTEDIIEAVERLTKPEGADYDEYVKKAAEHPVARAVKLNDLTDNMNLRRVTEPLTEKDLDRLNKYLRAYWFLSQNG